MVHFLTGWDLLPAPLLQQVYSCLTPFDAAQASRSCKRWNGVYVVHVRGELVATLEGQVVRLVENFKISFFERYFVRPETRSALEQVLTLDSATYDYRKRKTTGKRPIERLWNNLDEALQCNSNIPQKLVQSSHKAFAAVAKTLPPFKALRRANTLSKVQVEFKKAANRLATYGWKQGGQTYPKTATNLITCLIQTGQEFAIETLLDLDRFENTALLPPLTTSRIPCLLGAVLYARGFKTSHGKRDSAYDRTEELLDNTRRLEASNAKALVLKYDLKWACSYIVEALIKQKRYLEICELFEVEGVSVDFSTAQRAISCMLDDNAIEAATKTTAHFR